MPKRQSLSHAPRHDSHKLPLVSGSAKIFRAASGANADGKHQRRSIRIPTRPYRCNDSAIVQFPQFISGKCGTRFRTSSLRKVIHSDLHNWCIIGVDMRLSGVKLSIARRFFHQLTDQSSNSPQRRGSGSATARPSALTVGIRAELLPKQKCLQTRC
jgi:hypothetical protein